MECQKLKISLCLLMVLFLNCNVLCTCPSICSCFGSSRNADCSIRNLTTLPQGLQDNITHLNLSHNHLFNLDHQLTRFTNLRTLDVSHNFLRSIPSHLPKSLWELHATTNNIRVLHKHDTAHQWNLKLLDISKNMVERAVLINNTLSSLKFLNLSSNKLWTVPTNMPYNIKTVDLSNNFLTKILPATLERLPSLANLYLHCNRFTHIPNGAFDQLSQLKLITLYQNAWSCSERQNITYLLKWVMKTSALVIGYPCPNGTISSWNITLLATPPATKGTHMLVRGGPTVGTTKYLSLADETKSYKQYPFQDTTPSKASLLFRSTENPILDEEGSAVENVYVPASTEPGHIKDSIVIDLSNHVAKQLSTMTTLNILSGKPTKLPDTSQSTTVVLVKREPNTNVLNRHTPSSASVCQDCTFNVILLNALILFTFEMFTFSK